MESSYTVKTQVFEGPLDLLLELVSSRKLFVNDVSLAQVTDDFIRYIEEQVDFPIGESAEFILVASTLMLIKSRSLLPALELTDEEEESIHELENRLEIYARIKELSAELGKMYGKRIIFEKGERKTTPVIFAPDSKTDTSSLLASLERVIDALPRKEVLPKVTVKKVISLEEMIEKLAERISKVSRLSFGEVHNTRGKLSYEAKVSVIVGFLAMLELVKRGAIRVSQEGHDITIETEHIGIPHYA